MHLLRILAIMVALETVFAFQVTASNVPARRRLVGPPPQPGELAECWPGLVAKAGGVLDTAVDDEHVYYSAGRELMRAPKNGGANATTLTRLATQMIGLITIDATHVFFGSLDDMTGLGAVNALPKGGGTPHVIVPGVMVPYEITTDANYVYVSSLGTPTEDSFLPDGRIIRAKKDGSEVKILASALSLPLGLAVSGNDVFFSEADPTQDSGTLRRVSIDGGQVTTVVSDVVIASIAADGSGVYYSGIDLRTYERTITRVARDGFTRTVLVQEMGQSLRIIGTELYYVNFWSDTIEAVSVMGSAPRIIRAVELDYPRFSFDSCLLYHSSGEGVERSAQ